jgi:hypothetical protein
MLPRTIGTVRCLRGLGFGGGSEEPGVGLRVGVLGSISCVFKISSEEMKCRAGILVF